MTTTKYEEIRDLAQRLLSYEFEAVTGLPAELCDTWESCKENATDLGLTWGSPEWHAEADAQFRGYVEDAQANR